jgi:hypothetical protein
MVAMMASQELLAEIDPLIEEGPVYEGVGLAIFDYLEFWDLEGLQTLGMMTTKFTTPVAQPIPPAKPLTDTAANGQVAGTASFKDWVQIDQAYKQSIPQAISDGGKGVSN